MRKRQHWIFLGLFIILELLLIRRSFYGFNTADEMYFIGTSERLFRGEKLLIDEWNPTQQLCAFLLHPLYCLIRTALGSTEGIVMAMRFVYLIYNGVLTLFFYLRFQRRGYAAFGPAFLFLIFAPFSICAMSYNSIEFGIFPVILAVLSARMEHSVPEYILCGILMAVVVLANPFALSLYVLYGCICLGVTLHNCRAGRETEGALRVSSFFWMSVGAALLLVIFLLYVFQRGSLSEVLANLPHIVSDSEHQTDWWYKTWRYFHLCFKNYRWMFIGLGVIYVATALDRKRYAHGVVYMALATAAILPYLYYYTFVFDNIQVNYQMLPLAFWCLEAYFLTKNKDRRLFGWWYLPCVLFTVVVHYATNTGMVTISVAYGLCSGVGLLFAADWVREQKEMNEQSRAGEAKGAEKLGEADEQNKVHEQNKVCEQSTADEYGEQDEQRSCEKTDIAAKQIENEKLRSGHHWRRTAAAVIAVIALIAQFGGTLYLRMNYAWGENYMYKLTDRMTRGPLKGVYTTPETADWYGQILDELDSLGLTEEDELLVVGVAPWIYLYTEAGCGSYSTWQVHENSTVLYDYYALHPEKFPDVIYMAHWSDKFLESDLSNQFLDKGYTVVLQGTGTVLMSPERAAGQSS